MAKLSDHMWMLLIIIGALCIITLPISQAGLIDIGGYPITKEVALLTVAENTKNGDREGGVASLSVEIVPGSGEIYISSFPLTKLDTQISTRFANSVACKYVNVECDEYDFYYKITANSAIVGGPSAGAAISVVTIAGLLNLDLDNASVITGTISSGGVIGPVGGVKAKAEFAHQQGFEKILVPKWELNAAPEVTNSTSAKENKTNSPISNLTDQNKSNGPESYDNISVDIIRVLTLSEALEHMAQYTVEKDIAPIDVATSYEITMKEVAKLLCDRAIDMHKESDNIGWGSNSSMNLSRQAKENGLEAFNDGRHYSGASYCFSSNLIAKRDQLEQLDNQTLRVITRKLIYDIDRLDRAIGQKNINTMSDLEAFMVVRERLIDAFDAIRDINIAEPNPIRLGYAHERYFSALVWSSFFDIGGKSYELDTNQLHKACINKIAEAEEHINFVNLYLPSSLADTRRELKYAYEDRDNNDFALCIFKASKAKAEANLVLSVMNAGVKVKPAVEEKLQIASEIIRKQHTLGNFPILGYSYYEYASTLINTDDITPAALYTEYALELSNLDMYFHQERKNGNNKTVFETIMEQFFILGAIVGGIIVALIVAFFSMMLSQSSGDSKKSSTASIKLSSKKESATAEKRKSSSKPKSTKNKNPKRKKSKKQPKGFMYYD